MTKPNSSVADSTVVYQLSLLEQAINAPLLLVVGYGSPMKACVKACVKTRAARYGLRALKTRKEGFSCSGSARVALLGDKFDARLFANVCGYPGGKDVAVRARLLVCDTNFVADPLFAYGGASEWHLRAYPMEKDRSHSLWVECHPDPAFC